MQFRNSVLSELTIIEAENLQIKHATSDSYILILNVLVIDKEKKGKSRLQAEHKVSVYFHIGSFH